MAGPSLALRAIGVVRSPVSDAIDRGWDAIVSTIELDPELSGALDGLEAFSHALVVFWMHRAPAPAGVHRQPRERTDMGPVGLFAQRSRHRPNPIGVTAVEIVKVDPARLTVRGLDAIDGTPVLDLKPYVPAFDRREARVAAWMDEILADYFRA